MFFQDKLPPHLKPFLMEAKKCSLKPTSEIDNHSRNFEGSHFEPKFISQRRVLVWKGWKRSLRLFGSREEASLKLVDRLILLGMDIDSKIIFYLRAKFINN